MPSDPLAFPYRYRRGPRGVKVPQSGTSRSVPSATADVQKRNTGIASGGRFRRHILDAVANNLSPPTFVRILAEMEEMRVTMRILEHEVVRLLRENGVSWEAIGDELGVSRQAARSRFSQPKRRRDE